MNGDQGWGASLQPKTRKLDAEERQIGVQSLLYMKIQSQQRKSNTETINQINKTETKTQNTLMC